MRKAKLTKEDIKEILNLYFDKGESQTEIAKKLGTNQVAVTRIIGYYRSTKGGGKNCPKAYKAFVDEIKEDRLKGIALKSDEMRRFAFEDWRKLSEKAFTESMKEGITFKEVEQLGELRESAINYYHTELKGKTPHKCPVCDGRGFVPGGFYGTTTGNWSTGSTATEACRSCVNGIIWG